MQYKSTRDSSLRLNAAEVITAGISGDGGLFVPETLPGLTADDIAALTKNPMLSALNSSWENF